MTLETDLKAALGPEQVRFDAGAKALYATDASNYRHVPMGVLFPRTEADVIEAVAICRRHAAPILSRGAGTSLAGQTCNAAVIFDFSRHMNRILSIDPEKRLAVVEPGVILDHLRTAAEAHGLTFGPDPATHSRCTLGGMIGNNSCGVHALMAGKTVDNVEALEILTYDGTRMTVGLTSEEDLKQKQQLPGREGEIYRALTVLRDRYSALIRARYPRIPRRVSGYNLDELLPDKGFHVARALVGTEGTCVTVLKAHLRLVHSPKFRQLLVLGYSDVYQAAEAVPGLLSHRPIGLEGMDVGMVMPLKRYQGYDARIARLPAGEAWLLLEFGGETFEDARDRAHAAIHTAQSGTFGGPKPLASLLAQDPHESEDIWTIRESALAATAFIPGQRDRLEGWEDTAVPPEKLAPYLRDLRALYDRYGYRGAFYGHFGDGCLHTRIDFDIETAQGRQQMRQFLDEAADLVVRYGGSISGEHGDGQARAELLPKMFGPELVAAFGEFKAVWDPQDRMNPGKIVRPRGILDDLRLGDQFKAPTLKTHFQFADDQNSFTRALLRCVGVGKCRKEEGGLMCPSYQVTRNEADSTRGRAHMLFEMLNGKILRDGWRSHEAKESLDLCLSCKGCRSECPTNVDMASYKAEFLSHYYEGRLRPRAAYAFGYVMRWLRLASLAPTWINALLRLPGVAVILKNIAGIAPSRHIPPLATQTFRAWVNKRPIPSTPGPLKTVLLWPDTFTNHLQPQIGRAAVEALEHLGYRVIFPKAGLCCGRPLYDFGFLDQAKKQLRDILSALATDIDAGIPVIGLEPSCISVFRDELVNLFPHDERAKRLKAQTFLFSEFLLKEKALESVPKASAALEKAILQTHCHQKSVLTAAADRHVLKQLGIDFTEPESGCCGMAGAFGFEAGHEPVCDALGERALLPAVRNAAEETHVIASGFSCREQIHQHTPRQARHIAEIVRDALTR